MGVMVKREVIWRAIVTDALKEDLTQELEQTAQEVQQRIQQIDQQAKSYIQDLQRQDLQQAMNLRKRIDAEKKRHEELKDSILERKEQVAVLDNGSEIIRDTLESYVELEEGDDINVALAGTEIVTKNDVIVEIRQHEPGEAAVDEDEVSLEIATDLSDVET
ncbi:MAG: YlqD family protein [Armatimonadota bacterium]